MGDCGVGAARYQSIGQAKTYHVISIADRIARAGTAGRHDVADAVPLKTNANVSFQGVTPRAEIQSKRKKALKLPDADFTVVGDKARKILQSPNTVNGVPLTDTARPTTSGAPAKRRCQNA